MNITQSKIKNQINNCFDAFDPLWTEDFGTARQKNRFKRHLEETAGMKIEIENSVGMSYKLTSIEIVDEAKFTWWMLKWS